MSFSSTGDSFSRAQGSLSHMSSLSTNETRSKALVIYRAPRQEMETITS